MSLILPHELRVRVAIDPPDSCSLSDLLISLWFYLQGRFYFGTPVGLTNDSGIARISDTAVIHHFEEERAFFPLEYQDPLAACDSRALIQIRGGPDFHAARLAATTSGFAEPAAVNMWQRARNGDVDSATAWADLGHATDLLDVALRTQIASGGRVAGRV